MRASPRRAACAVALSLLVVCAAPPASAQTTDVLSIRGHAQRLYLYGKRGAQPVIVSSGDGGWIHLGPHVAETLAARGFFVVGFDVRAYLSSFTSGSSTLAAIDEPRDYAALVAYAQAGGTRKPILVGVSEGAGLSVLAATDPSTQKAIAGVIGLGLPDLNELGWRWKDAMIYLTHGVPNEPTFSVATIIDRVAPVPLAAIHSTHDEFVPLSEAQRIMTLAKPPRRLWTVDAANHRFSDRLPAFDQCLVEAIAWVNDNAPGK